MAVEFKHARGHVPILLHDGLDVHAKETILSPKHVTQTVVQVRIGRPLSLSVKCWIKASGSEPYPL